MPTPSACWSTRKSTEAIEAFFRRPAFDPGAEAVASEVLVQAFLTPALFVILIKIR